MGRSDSESGYDSDVDFRGRHKCTDIPCMVVFVATMLGLCYCINYANTNGNVKYLYHGVDAEGEFCGLTEKVKDKPYLYYCDDGKAVCLEACHTEGATVGECQSTAYKTTDVLKIFCLEHNSDHGHDNDFGSLMEKLGSDEMGMRHGKQVLAVAIAFGIILGYVFLWSMRQMARCLVYTLTALAALTMMLVGVMLWLEHWPGDESEEFPLRKKVAIVCFLAGVLIVPLFICFRKAINTSLACIRVAVLLMFKVPCLLLAPLTVIAVKVIMILGMILGFIHMLGLYKWTGVNGFLKSIDQGTDEEAAKAFWMANWMIGFFVFASYWAIMFVNAVYDFSVSYTAGFYYFSEPDDDDDRDVPCTVLPEGTFIAVAMHTGSLAYGSFMITVVSTIFGLMSWLDRQAEGGCNPVTRCIAKCCMWMCCACCFSGIIGFITQSCYTEMAITGGHSFCDSIDNVRQIMVDQGAAMVVMKAATFLLKVQGVLIIVGGSMIASYFWLCQDKYQNRASPDHIESPGLLHLMVAILAVVVGSSFMASFEAITESLLFCFAIDKMNNDGQVTTAPKDFLALYNDAEEIVYKKKKKEDKKNNKAKKKAEAAAEPLVHQGRPECKMGCGRLAAHGRMRNGHFYDTCCRGCATGGDHDEGCQG